MASDSGLIKLHAQDGEDLAVISALLQDALVPPGDIEYLADQQRFVCAANRYRWEASGDRQTGERILCGLSFEHVISVRRRNLDLGDRGKLLNFLALELVPTDGEPANEGVLIELTFSAGVAIRLQATALSCMLEDFGEAWPTLWRPKHD